MQPMNRSFYRENCIAEKFLLKAFQRRILSDYQLIINQIPLNKHKISFKTIRSRVWAPPKWSASLIPKA